MNRSNAMDDSMYPVFSRERERHWWFAGRRKIFLSALRRSVHTHDASVLDVGCGPGGNLPLLATFGRVTGLDMHADAVSRAKKLAYEKVIQADAMHMPFTDGMFDMVAAVDIIEHVDDDAGLIRELNRVLKPGGILFITTAAFPFLWSRLDDLSHHRRRYTRTSLMVAVKSVGVDTLLMRYYNVWLFPLIAAFRLCAKIRAGNPSKDADQLRDLRTPQHSINTLLKAILASERFVSSIPFPFGVSLFGIFRKP
ncbi:MAG: class I SAM-dependent methyltransferase [Parcubacteria group bacterium]